MGPPRPLEVSSAEAPPPASSYLAACCKRKQKGWGVGNPRLARFYSETPDPFLLQNAKLYMVSRVRSVAPVQACPGRNCSNRKA